MCNKVGKLAHFCIYRGGMIIKWMKLDPVYMEYLRMKHPSIPKLDYGDGKMKPFFPLFKIGSFTYVTQLSSPKARHDKMRESKDFIKLTRGDNTLISIVNLNYMFPVLSNNVQYYSEMEIRKIYSQTKNEFQVNKQMNFLKVQGNEILYKDVRNKAIDLYELKYEIPDHKASLRCHDFKEIEATCIEYEINLDNSGKLVDEENKYSVSRDGNDFVVTGEEETYYSYKELMTLDLKSFQKTVIENTNEMEM